MRRLCVGEFSSRIYEELIAVQEKADLILEGLTMAAGILEKTDELAEEICKFTGEDYQKIDEYAPRLLALRIAHFRAMQNEGQEGKS